MGRKMHPKHASGGREKNLKARALEEMKEYILITLYLWILFALFAEYKRLLLQENGINLWNQTYAIVNAMIFGKVVLLGEVLKVGRRLQEHALIWVVVGKSFIFTLLLMAFHVAEEAVRAWFQGKPVASSIQDFGGGSWQGIFVYAALLFVTLVPLFVFKEAQRVIGGDTLLRLLFQRRH